MRWLLRYQFALVGGLLGMTTHIYLVYGRGAWLSPQRIDSALSAGLIFGHVYAGMVLVARDFQYWIRERRNRQTSLFISAIFGAILGTLAWWVHVTLSLYHTNPDWLILFLGGVGLVSGFLVTPSVSPQKNAYWFGLLVAGTTAAIFLPIYLTHQSWQATLGTQNPEQAILYFQADNPSHIWIIGLPFAVILAFFAQLPVWIETH